MKQRNHGGKFGSFSDHPGKKTDTENNAISGMVASNDLAERPSGWPFLAIELVVLVE